METEVPFTDSTKEGRALKNPKKRNDKKTSQKKRNAVPGHNSECEKLNQHTCGIRQKL